MSLKVVVTTYNAMPYLRRCIDSIQMQTYSDFEVCIVDDASTQIGQRKYLDYVGRQTGWQILLHEENVGPLESRLHAVEALACQADDVVLLIDGDDWLYNNAVFGKIAALYETGRYDLTYGQHVAYPHAILGGTMPYFLASAPVPPEVGETRAFRQNPFYYFHLRTFRYFLWERIDDDDLRGPNGRYFRTMTDQAVVFPMIEMAFPRIYSFQEPLYVYNIDTPWRECRTQGATMRATELYIRSRPPYSPIERGR
jgi:glycosyltransferase involved in cell wall biosynthesis